MQREKQVDCWVPWDPAIAHLYHSLATDARDRGRKEQPIMTAKINARKVNAWTVEGELYAVLHKKVWVPAYYRGFDANFIKVRKRKRYGGYIFTGIGAGSGIIVDSLEDVEVRELSKEIKMRLAGLDQEYWRGFKAHVDAIQHWLNEQRRIEAEAQALCRQRGRLILIKR